MCNLFVDVFEVKIAPGTVKMCQSIMVSLKRGYLGVPLWTLFKRLAIRKVNLAFRVLSGAI